MARNLVNEPANILVPIEFASRAKALSKSGVEIEILTPAQMKKLGMGALLGVAQGSPARGTRGKMGQYAGHARRRPLGSSPAGL